MSMTSKVNPTLRAQILALLAGGVQRTNASIGIYCSYSTRAIQEATQKMTKDGTLQSKRTAGQTYYSVKPVLALPAAFLPVWKQRTV